MKELAVSKRTVALSVILLFGVVIILSMLTGYWKTESSKIPAKISEGEFAGEYNPADIRGSYTFEDIEAAFNVPVEVLAEAYRFAVTGDPGPVQPKLFEEYAQPVEGDVGTDSLRFFVSLYVGIPYQPEEDTKLPNSAIIVLRDKGKLGEEWMTFRDKYGVAMEEGPLSEGGSVSSNISHQEEEAGVLLEIKGRTTFGELYDAGLSEERVKEILGMAPGKSGTTVRDFLTNAGTEFSEYKTLLQAEIDAGAKQ